MVARVKISIYSSLREELGWKEKEVLVKDNATLMEVIRKESSLYKHLINEEGVLRSDYMILVNGIHIQFKDGARTRIHDGDEIAIFPPGGGG